MRQGLQNWIDQDTPQLAVPSNQVLAIICSLLSLPEHYLERRVNHAMFCKRYWLTHHVSCITLADVGMSHHGCPCYNAPAPHSHIHPMSSHCLLETACTTCCMLRYHICVPRCEYLLHNDRMSGPSYVQGACSSSFARSAASPAHHTLHVTGSNCLLHQTPIDESEPNLIQQREYVPQGMSMPLASRINSA